MASTSAILRHRRDTAANWTSANPVLEAGQLGFETDTRKSKLGDGTTAWNSLSYTGSGSSTATALQSGTLASRPGSAAVGDVYVTTNEDQFYIWLDR